LIYAIWRWIQLWLPYGFILWLYRRNKAIPANIKTREGNNFKAILITEDYGIMFSEDKYVENRGKFLLSQKRVLEEQNNEVIKELNSLNFKERERIYNGE